MDEEINPIMEYNNFGQSELDVTEVSLASYYLHTTVSAKRRMG